MTHFAFACNFSLYNRIRKIFIYVTNRAVCKTVRRGSFSQNTLSALYLARIVFDGSLHLTTICTICQALAERCEEWRMINCRFHCATELVSQEIKRWYHFKGLILMNLQAVLYSWMFGVTSCNINDVLNFGGVVNIWRAWELN